MSKKTLSLISTWGASKNIYGGTADNPPPTPTPLPSVPNPSNSAEALQSAEQKVREETQRRTQTVFTSPTGDLESAPVVRKSLLGTVKRKLLG